MLSDRRPGITDQTKRPAVELPVKDV